MNSILNFMANVINHVANIGGGLPSAGFSYQPKKPQNFQPSNIDEERKNKIQE